LPRPAAMIAAAQDLFDRAVGDFIETARRVGQLVSRVNADNETSAVLFFGCAAFYVVFHGFLRLRLTLLLDGIMVYCCARNRPVFITPQALTDSRERKRGRIAAPKRPPANRPAFSAVSRIVVKTRGQRDAMIIYRAFYREATQATAAIVAVLVVVFVL